MTLPEQINIDGITMDAAPEIVAAVRRIKVALDVGFRGTQYHRDVELIIGWVDEQERKYPSEGSRS